MKIIVSYRGISQSKGWATGDSVVRSLKRLGHEVYPYGNYYQTSQRLENEADLSEEFDLLLFLECNDSDPQYIHLRKINAKKRASWFFDVGCAASNYISLSNLMGFDYNFIANSRYVSSFHKGIYLPYAADKELHYRENATKSHSFSLIGSDRPERRQLIRCLNDAGIEAKLLSGVFREAYIDALASSWVIISDAAGGGDGLIPMRPYEAAAAGSCVISKNIDRIDEIFVIGKECLVYNSIDDLINICHTVKDNPAEMNDISAAGQRRVMIEHTYENRCKTILETINGN